MKRLGRTSTRLTSVCLAAVIACAAEAGISEEENNHSQERVAVTAKTSTRKMPAALAAAGFSRFAAAIEAAGLTEALEDEGPFTGFAPSDQAYDAMPDETKKLLKENPAGEQARAWIKYHFVKGVALRRDDLERIPGANGYADKYLRIWITPGKITVNRVCEITGFDIEAGNGVIHEVSRVLDATDEPKVFQKRTP